MASFPDERSHGPSSDEIAECAYYIYVSEGRPEGCAVEHWTQAEQQLALTRLHDAAASGNRKPGEDPGNG